MTTLLGRVRKQNKRQELGIIMGNTTGPHDQDTTIQIYPSPDCRFAYTLNNSQPVRCTWISDEPLFFADYEEAAEEDEILSDDPVFQALEKDIAELKGKTSVYEKISQDFVQDESALLAMFREDADFISAPAGSSSGDAAPLLAMLHKSRLASQYLSFAQLHGIRLELSRQTGDATYDREARVVLVRPDLSEAEQILSAARELRRVWQHKTGAGLHPLALHPDHAVLVHRAQCADLVLSMIRIAWELQLAGHKDAWARIENSQMKDLGRAFAREACVDFRSIHTGKAAAAAFESWFLSERCRKCDRVLIQQMLADYQGYMFSDNIEASRCVAADLLTALGKMPFGQNYLTASVTAIMNDPIFTDVRDRSNANFLWFIKFERSFSEAEQEVAAEASTEAEKMLEPDVPLSATIISFPTRMQTSPRRKAAGKGSAPSSSSGSSDE